MRSFRREAVPRVGPERRGGRARTASCGNSLRRVSLAARRVSGLLCSTLLVITLRVALRGNMAWPVRQAAAGLAKTPPCRKAGGAGNFVCRRRRRQRRWCRPAPYCAGRCCKAPAGATGALAGPWAWWWAMATPALSTPSRAGTGAGANGRHGVDVELNLTLFLQPFVELRRTLAATDGREKNFVSFSAFHSHLSCRWRHLAARAARCHSPQCLPLLEATTREQLAFPPCKYAQDDAGHGAIPTRAESGEAPARAVTKHCAPRADVARRAPRHCRPSAERSSTNPGPLTAPLRLIGATTSRPPPASGRQGVPTGTSPT